jgi:hypothetical protein
MPTKSNINHQNKKDEHFFLSTVSSSINCELHKRNHEFTIGSNNDIDLSSKYFYAVTSELSQHTIPRYPESNNRSNNNVSEWLLFSANSAPFQLYHGENKLIVNEMMMRSALYSINSLSLIVIVLAHWNSPRIDM